MRSDITVIIIQSLFQFWVWAVTVTYVLYGFGRGLVGVWSGFGRVWVVTVAYSVIIIQSHFFNFGFEKGCVVVAAYNSLGSDSDICFVWVW